MWSGGHGGGGGGGGDKCTVCVDLLFIVPQTRFENGNFTFAPFFKVISILVIIIKHCISKIFYYRTMWSLIK